MEMEETAAVRPRYKIINGNALKLIALIAMLIDHIGAAVLEAGMISGYNEGTLAIPYERVLWWWNVDRVLRAVGRIAFPIYCFLLVEGFLHTRDVRKYALRMALFALVSEIPFDLAFYHTVWNAGQQNVFFTLFLGLMAMAAVRYCEERFCSRWLGLTAAVCCCMLGDVLCADYGAFGVLLILVLYMFRDRGWLRLLLGCALTAWEVTAPLAFVPIGMYNGERGRLRLKYIFYWFYPVHLVVLYAVCRLLF